MQGLRSHPDLLESRGPQGIVGKLMRRKRPSEFPVGREEAALRFIFSLSCMRTSLPDPDEGIAAGGSPPSTQGGRLLAGAGRVVSILACEVLVSRYFYSFTVIMMIKDTQQKTYHFEVYS